MSEATLSNEEYIQSQIIPPEVKDLVKNVWDDRENDRHGWTRCGDNWLTIVPEGSEDGDFLEVALVEKIDVLGYPFSGRLCTVTLFEDDLHDLGILP